MRTRWENLRRSIASHVAGRRQLIAARWTLTERGLRRRLRAHADAEARRRRAMALPGALRPVEVSRHSQHGEDGIIAAIFERIGTGARTFVEIGAADGAENCTRALVEQGWTGVWLEGDPGLAAAAEAVVGARPVTVVAGFVDRRNIVGLAASWTSGPQLDLLVIDIDGNDYWIWSEIGGQLRPRVVVIEYNGTFGPTTHWVSRYDGERQWDETADHGAALAALVALGDRLGYRLVHCDESGTNAFFVTRSEADTAGFPPCTPRQLFQPPVHKLPNGHPVRRWAAHPTVPTAPADTVTVDLVWISTRRPAPGQAVYWITRLANHGSVDIGNDAPRPTLVTWSWSAVAASDDGRHREPERVSVEPWSLRPGASRLLPGRASAPSTPGAYDLVIGVVQEGVRWFEDPPRTTTFAVEVV